MKKLACGISVLIALGLCAYAQDYRGQSAKGSSTNQTTIQGCLSRSAGGFTLTDNSGTAYQLAGDTAKLTDHVGHQVEITGTTAVSGEAPAASSAPTKDVAPARIDVSNLKHISSTCSSKPDTGLEKSPMDK
jgi:hypothetical protein